MAKEYVLYQHAGSGNHGCEALVRTVIETIRQIQNDARFILVTSNIEDDKKYGLDEISGLKIVELNKTIKKGNINWLLLQIAKIFHLNSLRLKATFNLNWIKEDRYYIAIGGDNYCYNKGKSFYPIDNVIEGKKILWGCSVEPSDLDEDLIQHLKQFDVITVREPLTRKALEAAGLINVKYAPDTAFILPSIKQKYEKNRKYVGINISPMILNYAKDANAIINNYCHLIEFILKETDMNIIFVPHVISENNDDRIAIKTLIKATQIPSDRYYVVNDDNCQMIKGKIGACDYFIGARTHSTIAAYSQFIPTLVMGYSVKSLGIAEDLFGTSEHYVIPVTSLIDQEALTEAFKWILQNENTIKNCLERVVPEKQKEIIDNYHKILNEW